MTSFPIFAETLQRDYIKSLKAEMNACLENIEEATELLHKDEWHVEASLMLTADTSQLTRLHNELGKVLEEAPVNWLKEMIKEAQA